MIDDTDSACGNVLKFSVEMKVDQSEPRPRTDRGTVSGRRWPFKYRQKKPIRETNVEHQRIIQYETIKSAVMVTANCSIKQTECARLQPWPPKTQKQRVPLAKREPQYSLPEGSLKVTSELSSNQSVSKTKDDRLDAEVAWAHNLLNETPEEDTRR